MKSVLLALLVLLLCALCAWGVLHFGRRAGEPERRLRRIARGFVVGGALLALFTFTVDRGQRRITLFEVVLPAAPADVVEFDVEHPDAEHRLLVVPRPPPGRSAAGPCDLHVRWLDPDGRVLVEDRVRLERRGEGARLSSRRWTWDAGSWSVTPGVVGRHRLELELQAPNAAATLVRIEDPRKTDGVRARGY